MTHIPAEWTSWVEIPETCDFPIQNIPFGIFRSDRHTPRAASIIGNYIIDLKALADKGFLSGTGIPDTEVFGCTSLNHFIGLGKNVTNAVRMRIAELLKSDNRLLQDNELLKAEVFIPREEVQMLMPLEVGDYTDFYSSIEHATNVGIMFRGKENALMPNWKHLPVGYHGRASSIIVSGTNFHRPKGQLKPKEDEPPVFGATRLLDIEVEMGFVVGQNTELGDSVPIGKAEEYIFGLLLLNDWSARDIQKWEYVPLGPFLGKNFASSISPWIVTLEALEPFRVPGPKQDPEVLDYLKYDGKKNYDIKLQAAIEVEGYEPKVISNTNFKYLYWNMCQQLAHHTVNGCNIRVGDIYASGTISGKSENSYGSLLEITWRGSKPVAMPDGTERKFLKDGDTVTLKGFAEKDGLRIGFGEVRTTILPVKN